MEKEKEGEQKERVKIRRESMGRVARGGEGQKEEITREESKKLETRGKWGATA